MHIKPIMSSMLRNKAISTLIILEIALTLAFVSNAMFFVYESVKRMNMSTGIAIENMIAVHPQGYSSDFDIRQAAIDDLETMRSTPGVVSASPVLAIPGTGWAGQTNFYVEPKEDAHHSTIYYYQSDHSIIDTLGIEITQGRAFNQSDIQYLSNRDPRNPGNLIISQALADKLFPEGNAIGKPVWLNHTGDPATIIGTYKHLSGSNWDILNREMTALFPQVIYEKGYDPNYIVRTEPDKAKQLVSILDEKLSHTPGRVIGDILTIKEYRSRNFGADRISSIILVTVTILLVLVTSLGIAGLTAYTVNKRRRQIGTRRALGANKTDILKYFLTENWIMSTLGIILGTILAFLISFALATIFQSNPLNIPFLIGNIIGLWILGLLAVWGPAKRASEIEPAIATRSA